MKLFNEELLPDFIESAEHSTVDFLADYIQKSGQKGYVIGISGGIDSAVVSTLCAMTGYPLMCIEMPIHQNPEHLARGKNHIANLKSRFSNVESVEIDLTESFDGLASTFNSSLFVNMDNAELALANTRSRLRMMTLYAYANNNGFLVAGTGNRVEDFGVGFFTKGGDGVVDVSPIGDLMKSEVRLLARRIGVLEEIVNATPSDGLWGDSRSDEDQIGASYDELEWAMLYTESHGYLVGEGHSSKLEVAESSFEGISLTERQKEVLKLFLNRHNVNRHKMNSIPVCEQDRDMLSLKLTFEK